ncbi:MAG: hypothetical protein WEC72_01620 [Chthoniobacterales bacterium]
MIRTAALVVAIYLALVAQEFIPPLPFLGGAHLLLVPMLFCYGALWLSFPAMLGLALYTGLVSDLAFLHVVGDHVEIGLGWSMLFYVFVGTALQPLRPLFLAGRWEVHCLAGGAVTFLLLLAQYIMVCLRRGSFIFDETIFWHLVGPAILALLLAPVASFILGLLPAGRWAPRVRPGGGLTR